MLRIKNAYCNAASAALQQQIVMVAAFGAKFRGYKG